MRTGTHLLAGAAAGIAFGPNILCVFSSMLGARLPDKADSLISHNSDHERRREKWDRWHRTFSHNFSYWLLLFAAFWLSFGCIGNMISEIILFFFIGVASHLMLDFMNPMGIPLWPGGKRRSLHVCRAYTLQDWLIGFSLFTMALAYRVFRVGIDSSFFFL